MNAWEKLLSVAKDVAPALAGTAATAATGNPLAGAAVIALAKKITGAAAGADLNDVAEDILVDPEKIQQFRLEMRKLELDELKVHTLDVQDARKTIRYSHGSFILSTIVVLAYFITVVVVMTSPLPVGSENIAYLVIGTLGTGFGLVLHFWVGTSTGSKEKDAINAAYAEAARLDAKARIDHLESSNKAT